MSQRIWRILAILSVLLALALNVTALLAQEEASEQEPVAPLLFLEILEPADELVELEESVERFVVFGWTLPGAVVSVNGELADLEEDGLFSAEVFLEEGTNLVEIVASDDSDQELAVLRFIVNGP